MDLALTEKKTRGRARCVQRRKKVNRMMVLAVSDTDDKNCGNWILDSGASRHRVNDETLLIDSAACNHEIAIADGESLRLTQVDSV